MLKIYKLLIISFFSILLFSCASKPEVNPVETEPVVTPVQEKTDEVTPVSEPQAEPVVVPEPVKESQPEIITEPVVEKNDEKIEEYIRSTSNLEEGAVSPDEFEQDKKAILNIISELDIIMTNRDYAGWLGYLSQDSILYWRNSANLASVSNRLPIKGLKLKNLEDYFRFVFIQSRMNKSVDEIRYVSSKLVKAVQVRKYPDHIEDVIYYTFEKFNGKWLLVLDKLDN
jgi:hypothetical protein